MNLNTTHRRIMIVTLSIIAVMCLFPPWKYTFNGAYNQSSENPAGYSFIASPPPKKNSGYGAGVKLDILQLFVQLVSIISISGFFILITTKRNDNTN